MSKKLGFALGAGGSRGVAHIGFLNAMEEAGIVADFVAGTSMGSVVGACYCAGYSADYMKKEVEKLTMSDIFDLSINPIKNGALLRAQKMRKKLASYFTKTPTFNHLKIPFRSVAVDLISGNLKVFTGDDEVAEGVAASSSIPTIFKPVEKDGMLLVDGGVRCRVPIEQVREMGAEVVIAVDVLGKLRPTTKKLNLFAVSFRVFDIMDDDITDRKMKELNADLYLAPDLGDMTPYQFKGIENAYNVGYELGKANAEKIKNLIV